MQRLTDVFAPRMAVPYPKPFVEMYVEYAVVVLGMLNATETGNVAVKGLVVLANADVELRRWR